jgi:hypothetical protein
MLMRREEVIAIETPQAGPGTVEAKKNGNHTL